MKNENVAKVMVAVPCADRPQPLCMESLFAVARYGREKYELEVTMPSGYSCEMARNEAVIRFMESDCDWLWFVDSDIVLTENSLERLLDADSDIISGVYFRKLPANEERIAEVCRLEGEETVFYRESELPRGRFVAAGVGGGCLLIRRRAMHHALLACGNNRPFVYQMEPVLIAEDLWFCNLVTSLGYTILVDGELRLGHVGTAVY